MSIWTVPAFLFGRSAAINVVAANRASLYVGVWLVLLTAVARNYDQTYFLETPLWLVGPLLFSIFSGSFLFSMLYWLFLHRRFESLEGVTASGQWRSFMGLFWMTAPVAWLYAIPVERWFDSYGAAQANLGLLGVVSAWRVILMSRIVSVIQGVNFGRALCWVLLPASLEVIGIIFFGAIFGGSFGKGIMAAMGGMRNSPEENLLLSALANVFLGAWIVLGSIILAQIFWRPNVTARPFPESATSRLPVPIAGLVILTIFWTVVAVPNQLQQKRFVAHAALISSANYRAALEYLAHFKPHNFPASRRLEPNPYEYGAFEHLPKTAAALRPNDPAWIRQLYLEHLDALFTHSFIRAEAVDLAAMFQAIEKLPEGKARFQRNKPQLYKALTGYVGSGFSDAQRAASEEQITNALERAGVNANELKRTGSF